MTEIDIEVRKQDSRDRMRAHQSEDRAKRNEVMIAVHKAYIGTPRDADLEEAIQLLIDSCIRHGDAKQAGSDFSVGRLAENRSLFLLGGSGEGKTRALQRAFLKFPEFENYGDPAGGCLLISVNVPSPFTLRELGQSLAKAAGYETDEIMRENRVWSLLHKLLEGRVLFIHIDEAQKFLESNNPIEIIKAVNALRGLMQSSTWPIALILSGTMAAAPLVADFQIGRRKSVVIFRELSTNEDGAALLRHALRTLCEKAGISSGGVLDDAEIVERLMHASLYRLGVSIEYMQDAIELALRQKSTVLNVGYFAKAYSHRTGCENHQNIMTVEEGWLGLDAEPLLFPEAVAAGDEESHKPKREQRPK